ncbi:MAG: ABC transporter ATP-binding protein [Bacillota bacterium]
MRDVVLDVQNVGKSYRSYSKQWWRFWGWITGRPKHFIEHWVLRDVSFSAYRGESIGILGRNGAGKSTLLKIIAGILTPSKGIVHRVGRITAILELGIGFNPDLSARENVIQTCGLLGYSRSEILAAMPAIEDFADIGEYFDQPLRTFSSGMQMRVAFAAATAFRPDILIVDEALSVGDVSFQAKCFERINKLRESGATLLFVSHSVTDVLKHCERALFIKDGMLALDGPAKEVSNAYLDYMFSKTDRAHSRKTMIGKPASLIFNTETTDIFSSRPMYRKEEYRWGIGGAAIVDYSVEADGEVFPAQFITHQTVRISFKVFFKKDVQRPVYGLLIKTIEGIYLYGTNCRLANPGSRSKPVCAGDVRIAAFEFPLMLNQGAYLISLGVSEEREQGEFVPLDRRYDSIIMTVHNENAGTGLLDLKATFLLIDGGGRDNFASTCK